MITAKTYDNLNRLAQITSTSTSTADSPPSYGYQYNAPNQLRNYTWDGENRLVRMISAAGVGPQQRIDFEYDWQGRRIGKKVWNNTTGSGAPALERRFLYDGWNLVAELDGANATVRTYHWGLDLSGSRSGAGGVGGLIAVGANSGGFGWFAAYDGNGNVMGLIHNTTGQIETRYEYGPFGEPIRSTGTSGLNLSNPFRFSSKYEDDETGYLYYGYRYYNPVTGRWPNRDPIEERGGFNQYNFNHDSPITFIDPDGKSPGKIALGVAAAATLYWWIKSPAVPPPTSPLSVVVPACTLNVYVSHGLLDSAFDDDGKAPIRALANQNVPLFIDGIPGCSGAAVVGCNAAKIVRRNNVAIEGYTTPDKEIIMAPAINAEIQSAYASAMAYAQKACRSFCNCQNITINVICTGLSAKTYPQCGTTTVVPCKRGMSQ